ncbi:hypothetical protein ACTQ1O_02330 [Bilifractor sp. LCP21S3_A7]
MRQRQKIGRMGFRRQQSGGTGFIYANSEPQPNAKYSCAASAAIAR